MHADCLIAEFATMEKAKVGLEVLAMNDFASDAVSIAYRGHEEALQSIDDRNTTEGEQPHDLAHSVEVGAVLGAAAVTYISIATIMIPIMIAGPLVGLAAGAAVGGLFGEVKHWGVHDHAAMQYAQRVADGSILVIVTSTPHRLDEARAFLRTCGPETLERFSRHRSHS